jgi:hypothetical protein
MKNSSQINISIPSKTLKQHGLSTVKSLLTRHINIHIKEAVDREIKNLIYTQVSGWLQNYIFTKNKYINKKIREQIDYLFNECNYNKEMIVGRIKKELDEQIKDFEVELK